MVPPRRRGQFPQGGRITVNKDEADQVRTIFSSYIEKASLLAVVQELRHRGWRRKTWTTRDGKVRIGGEMTIHFSATGATALAVDAVS